MKKLRKSILRLFWSKRLVAYCLIGLCFFGCKQTPSEQIISEFREVLNRVEEYEYGQSRHWLQQYRDVFARMYNDSTIHQEAERLMIRLLKSKASQQSKLLICESLASLGSEASLPVLRELLAGPETAHMALIALTHIPAEEVGRLLMDELPKSEDVQVVAILNTLALRKSDKAVDAISLYLQDDEPMISNAAVNALGKIGGEKAIMILYDEFEDTQSNEIAEALIDALMDSPHPESIKIYGAIYESDISLSNKTAAFEGILNNMAQNEQVDFLLSTLQESDLDFRQSLIPAIRSLDDNLSLDKMVTALSGFGPPFQYQLMLVIADRGDIEVRSFALKLLSSSNYEARVAALRAIKSVSTSDDLQLLAKIASTKTGLEQDLARSCIYWMNDADTDERIMALAHTTTAQQKAEYIMAMGYRKIEEATAYVVDQVANGNGLVRNAALESAGKIASKDYLDEVLKNAFSCELNETEMSLIVDALTRISMNSNSPDWCVGKINEKLSETKNDLQIAAMVQTLGNIGNEAAGEIIKTYLNSANERIQLACLQAFANWANDDPLSDIERMLPNITSTKNRQQATVAIVNLVQRSGSLSSDDKAYRMIGLYPDARSSNEKIILLNGLSRLGSFKAMDFILLQLSDEQINKNAQEAFIRIADNLRYGNEKRVLENLDSLIVSTDQEDFKSKLTILKRSIEL